MLEFRDILINTRAELNLSLRKAAEKIGISHTYLAALEKGIDSRGLPATKPTPETLKLISDEYHISYDLLMEACGYVANDSKLNERISNPDIRMIARAGKKMTDEQAESLRKYAQFMFPEVFDDKPNKQI